MLPVENAEGDCDGLFFLDRLEAGPDLFDRDFCLSGCSPRQVRREPDQCPAGMDEGPAGAQDTGVTTKPIMLLVQKFLEKLGYPCETRKRAEHWKFRGERFDLVISDIADGN